MEVVGRFLPIHMYIVCQYTMSTAKKTERAFNVRQLLSDTSDTVTIDDEKVSTFHLKQQLRDVSERSGNIYE